MAIYTRLLNGATGPTQRFQVPQSVPYVDDMFDPLFNREVVDYNKSLYGNRIMGTLAGYAQMWDHALTGEGGILGPGMGVLSTFGRSMDKADDLILGGLTEGVNALGHNALHGSNDAPQNPLRNIMVNDYDYTGTKLLAAMGNSMSRMAGGAKLDETDFAGMGDRLSGSALDMMTDPGWLGSRLAKGKGLAAEVGSVLDSYDNAMAKVAGNVALPGMQQLAHKNMERIRRLLAANSPENMMEYAFEYVPDPTSATQFSPDDVSTLEDEYLKWHKVAEEGGYATLDESVAADVFKLNKVAKQHVAAKKASARVPAVPAAPAAAPAMDVTDSAVGQPASNPSGMPSLYPNVDKLYADPAFDDYISHDIAYNINKIKKLRTDDAAEDFRRLQNLIGEFPDATRLAGAHDDAATKQLITDNPWLFDAHGNVSGIPNDYAEAKMAGTPMNKAWLDLDEHKDLKKKYVAWLKENGLELTDNNVPGDNPKDAVYKVYDPQDPEQPDLSEFYGLDAYVATLWPQIGDPPESVQYLIDRMDPETGKLGKDLASRQLFADYFMRASHDKFAKPSTPVYVTKKSAWVRDKTKEPTEQAFLAATRRLAARVGIEDVTGKNAETLLKELIPDASVGKTLDTKRVRDIVTRLLTFEEMHSMSNPVRQKTLSYSEDFLKKTRPAAYKALYGKNPKAKNALVVPDTASKLFPDVPGDPVFDKSHFDDYVLWARTVNAILDASGAEVGKRKDVLGLGFDDTLSSTRGRTDSEELSNALALEKEGINPGAEISRALPYLKATGLSDLTKIHNILSTATVKDANTKYRPNGLEIRIDASRLKYLPIDMDIDDLPGDAQILFKAKQQMAKRLKPYEYDLEIELGKPVANQNKAKIKQCRDAIARNSYIELTKAERDALPADSAAWYLFGDVVSWQDKKTGEYRSRWQSPVNRFGAYSAEHTNGWTGEKFIADNLPAGKDGKYRYFYGPAQPAYVEHMKRLFKPVKDPLSSIVQNTYKVGDDAVRVWELNTGDRDILQYFMPHERHGRQKSLADASVDEIGYRYAADKLFGDGIDMSPLPHNIRSDWTHRYHNWDKTEVGREYQNRVGAPHPEVASADAPATPLTAAVLQSAGSAAESPGVKAVMNPNATAVDITCQDIADAVYGYDYSDSPVSPDSLATWVKQYGSPRQKTLFVYLNNMKQNAILVPRGVNQYQKHSRVDWLVKTAKRIAAKHMRHDDLGNEIGFDTTVSTYLKLRDASEDQIIEGSDFLSGLVSAGGRRLGHYADKFSDADYAALKTGLQKNVDAVNKAAGGSVLKFVEGKSANGTRTIGYMFDVDNLDIKKDWNRLFSVFSKPLYLDDVTFQKASKTAQAMLQDEEYAELNDLFNRVSDQAGSFYRKLGIPMDTSSPSYFHHTMRDTPEAAATFADILTSVGIRGTDANGIAFDNDAKLAQIVNALENSNAPSIRGQFGTKQYKRSYLGHLDAYGNAFSDDIRTIVADTFTKGSLDNINANTAQALFFNDNFGVNSYFETKENLIDAVRQKNEKGVYSGNMANLDLVSPKIDDNGKVVGFTHYDKLSDIDVDRAWKSGRAILVPTEIVGKLDRLLRKNARMSSPAYRFFNKFLTLPFKFGVLANPGFLAGNVQDAYYKQAEVMSEKYGTSIEEELANVGMQYRRTVQLNNQFDDVRQKYETFLKNALDSAKETDTSSLRNAYGKSMGVIKKGGHLDAAVIMQNPDYFKEWINYMNNELPKGSKELRIAKFYTALNSYQSLAEFENNQLDLEDVLATSDASRRGNAYDRPTSFVERLMYGDASKRDPEKGTLGNINAYGLALNNPYSDAILKKSNQFESLTRTATILNDLEHRGFTQDKIDEILSNDPAVEKAMYQDLHIKIMDAVNVMNTANFDYDTVSDLMDKASYVIPFPTFYMKNMAFWLNTLAEHPERLDDIISFQESLWAGVPQKDEYAKEAKGRGAYPIGVGNQHLTGIVKQSPINSMFGAFNSLNNFVPDLSYRLNPVTRPITRHLQNPEDIKYRPYSTDVYEKNINAKSSQFSDLAYLFHQLNPFERFVNTALRTPRKVATNQAQLSDFAPSMFQPNFNK